MEEIIRIIKMNKKIKYIKENARKIDNRIENQNILYVKVTYIFC